jgi:hypothetical protein
MTYRTNHLSEHNMARLTGLAVGVLLAVMTTGAALAEWSGAAKPGVAKTAVLTGNAAGKGSSLTGLTGTKGLPVAQHPEKPKPAIGLSGAAKPGVAKTAALTGNAASKGSSLTGLPFRLIHGLETNCNPRPSIPGTA